MEQKKKKAEHGRCPDCDYPLDENGFCGPCSEGYELHDASGPQHEGD